MKPVIISINGQKFTPRPDCNYRYDYVKIATDIANGNKDENGTYRTLCKRDSWFFLYFVLGIKKANHPFIVKACRDVDEGPATNTVDIWARDHFKSTIITVTESIQKILRNPEERICILSYVKPLAQSFVNQIKQILEGSAFLKSLFPDVLYENPDKESPRWGVDSGLQVKRKSFAKEATVEAAGLTDGMPTGRHYTHRVFDDIETRDIANSPDVMDKVKTNFDLAENIGASETEEDMAAGVTSTDTQRVIGTYYSHLGPLVYITEKKRPDGTPMFHLRLKPATHDGSPNGQPVLVSQEKLDRLRTNLETFYTQQLCNPTPQGTQKLDFDSIRIIPKEKLPKRLFRFMVVDPAGKRKEKVSGQDSWAMATIGISPFFDESGLVDMYILDLVIEPMEDDEAMRRVVDMFVRGGRVQKIAVEKVALSSTEIHISNALKARGRNLTVDNEGIRILTPAGRPKEFRIVNNISPSLRAGKIHMLESIPRAYRDRLEFEMRKFPAWHDDGLDCLSYAWDVAGDYRISKLPAEEVEKKTVDKYDEALKKEFGASGDYGWLM